MTSSSRGIKDKDYPWEAALHKPLAAGKQQILPEKINTSSIKPLGVLLAALLSRFPTAVCLCDLKGGLDKLSDLLTFQLDCWLQEKRGGGDGVSHGAVADWCRRGHQGLDLFSQLCFHIRFPVDNVFPADRQSHSPAGAVIYLAQKGLKIFLLPFFTFCFSISAGQWLHSMWAL